MTLRAVPPPPDEEPERTPPEILRLGDLLDEEFDPIVWTVPGLLARGNCDMLAGKAKMGKSRLALAIALAIALGGYALGKFKVIQGDVLYLALEDGKRRLQFRLKKLLAHDAGADLSHFYSSCEWAPVDEGGIEFLEQWIEKVTNPTLIVVDTLIRVHPSEDMRKEMYKRDYAAIKPLVELAHRRTVGILLVHHTRKAEAEDWLDEVQGSTGTTAATDGTIILRRKRGKKDAVLNVVSRDLIDEPSFALLADDVTGGWTFTGNAEDVEISESRLTILQHLEERQQYGMRVNELARLLTKTDQAVWNLLNAMKHDGLVAPAGNGPWRITIKGSLMLTGKPETASVNGVNRVFPADESAGNTPFTRNTRALFNQPDDEPEAF